VAREISHRLKEAELVPMVAPLGEQGSAVDATDIVLVFPTHVNIIPYPVRQFLLKVDLAAAEYIGAVATGGGGFNVCRAAVDRILKRKGKELDAYFFVQMVFNTPTGIMPIEAGENWHHQFTDEKLAAIDDRLPGQLDHIAESITERKPNTEGKGLKESLLEWPITLLTRNATTKLAFYVDETCTACGLCEQVCPSGRIELEDEVPVWHEDTKCFYCYACFNFCLEQAILLDNYARKQGRYLHPSVSAQDMRAQREPREHDR
jgi:ferredoxin